MDKFQSNTRIGRADLTLNAENEIHPCLQSIICPREKMEGIPKTLLHQFCKQVLKYELLEPDAKKDARNTFFANNDGEDENEGPYFCVLI